MVGSSFDQEGECDILFQISTWTKLNISKNKEQEMQKLKVNPLIYRAFPLYFLDSCFLFLLKIKYVFPLMCLVEIK